MSNKHFIDVQKDFSNINTKFLLGLTKRQVICFGIGIALGAPAFFISKQFLSITGAAFVMAFFAAPPIACGLYKRNGVFLEQKAKMFIRFLKKPKKRIYKEVNTYECIENYYEYKRIKKALAMSEKGVAPNVRKKKAKTGDKELKVGV